MSQVSQAVKVAIDESRNTSKFRVSVSPKISGKPNRAKHHFRTREEAAAFIIAVHNRGYLAALGSIDAVTGAVVGAGSFREVSELWEERHEHVGKKTFYQVRHVLGSLRRFFGGRDIKSITHIDVDRWLGSIEGAHETRKNHYRIARRFFRWAHEWLEVIPRNPMVKVELKVKKGSSLPKQETLTPEQMEKCLRFANALKPEHERVRLLAYLCLGGFAGLRTEEILSCHWEDMDWKSGEIYVRQPKRVEGWKPRYVQMLLVFRHWLEAVAPAQELTFEVDREGRGPMSFSSPKVLPGGQRTLYLLRAKLRDVIGVEEWPDNCLRHSYATHHLAAFKNLYSTAEEMGHDPGITKRHYVVAAKKAHGEDWMRIGMVEKSRSKSKAARHKRAGADRLAG